MYVVLSIYTHHNKSYRLLFGPGLVSSYTVISSLTRYHRIWNTIIIKIELLIAIK